MTKDIENQVANMARAAFRLFENAKDDNDDDTAEIKITVSGSILKTAALVEQGVELSDAVAQNFLPEARFDALVNLQKIGQF